MMNCGRANKKIRKKNCLYQKKREKRKKLPELNAVLFINVKKSKLCCLRPYHVENTGSRPITEVKQRRAPVSTWMGDRLGIPGAVDFLHFFKAVIYFIYLLLFFFLDSIRLS